MYDEKFYQLHAAQRQLLRPLNNPEKTYPWYTYHRCTNTSKTSLVTYPTRLEIYNFKFLSNEVPHWDASLVSLYHAIVKLIYHFSPYLYSYFVNVGSEGSSKSVHIRRFAWAVTFAMTTKFSCTGQIII